MPRGSASAAPHPNAGPNAGPDAWRIEVHRRPGMGDPAGDGVADALAELGLARPRAARVAKGYLLSPAYGREAVEAIAREVLADPVVDEFRIDAPGQSTVRRDEGIHRILIAPRPGVMDPVARTVEALLAHAGRAPEGAQPDVGTFRVVELAARYSARELEGAARLLANETVEVVRVDREDLPYRVAFPSAPRGRVEVPLLGLDDDALLELSRSGQLSLSLTEMRAIQAHYAALGREPSACELETLAQTWSEHCKHKTLTGRIEFTPPGGGPTETIDNLLKSTIARATRTLARPWCISVFEDNAGIVEFDQGHDLAIKVETHNHPSAIDPYGGAGTGIGGVIRDILGAGLGARPVANTDAFFVGPPDLPGERVPKGSLHPRRILRGVVAGVRDYGNRMGIPTVSGGVWFDEGYVANPLVYAGTLGILPRGAAFKKVQPGDVIVAVGGRTGRDGIHGATFSSIELSEDSETVSSSAVQIGDPITEKRTLDCLIQARDRGLYRAVTDCGAGGYSSAVGEMGEHTGADVELAAVRLKYPGLSSHEIWISEAQERMVLAVPPEHLEALRALFAAEDVESEVLGTFPGDGMLRVRDGGALVCELEMAFLHGGTPRPLRRAAWTPPAEPDPGAPAPEDHGALLLEALAAPEVASKGWIVHQYDHEVQGTSVLKPLVGARADGPGDGAVLQPLASSRRGAVLTCGANTRTGRLDPYAMALANVDEALRNAVAVGADPARVALLDNFSWGNCDLPDRLGQLVLAARACHDAALAYGAPFVSGKDSLNNEYRVGDRTLAIPPTLLITALAQIPDIGRAVSMDAKRAGDALYLVGATRAELGGSLYLALRGLGGGAVPRPDLGRAPGLFAALHGFLREGHAAAVHDLSEGGLAVAAAEMAFAGDLGIDLELAGVPWEGPEAPTGDAWDGDTARLWSESCSRFLVEVAPQHAAALERALAGFPHARVGAVVAAPRLRIAGRAGAPLLELDLGRLREAFHSAFGG